MSQAYTGSKDQRKLRELSVIFKQAWPLKAVPENGKEYYTSLTDGHKGGSEELQANQLLWNPWEGDGANRPGHPFKQLRGKGTGNSQQRFTTGKSCLANLMDSVNNGRPGMVLPDIAKHSTATQSPYSRTGEVRTE